MNKEFVNIVKKNVDNCFSFIHKIENDNEYDIQSSAASLNHSKAKTYIEDGSFCLAFYTNGLLNQIERNSLLDSKVNFIIKNQYHSLVFDIKSFSHITTLLMNEPNRFNCKIRKYYNPEIQNTGERYYRIIIPTKIQQRPGGIFQSDSVTIASTTHSKGLITIKYLHLLFHLYAYNIKEKDSNYLIIDTIKEMEFSEFKKNVENILLAYSFITGYFPRDRRYILSSDDSHFENIYGIMFETVAKSFESSYSVFPTSDLRIYFNLPQNIYFPQKYFNKLCSILLTHQELNRVLFLIVEGHTLSIELRASIYTVALETLTNIISAENDSKLLPISNKTISKNMIKDLISVLEKYKDQFNQNGKDTLLRKISVINSPTNKQKLIKPFELLNLKLKDKEVDAINKRNDFLHGRSPYNYEDEESEFKLQQLALTLLYCVTILVLKYVGYSGYVMYYPSINEFKNKKEISDFILKII